jgi:hypothetical protein
VFYIRVYLEASSTISTYKRGSLKVNRTFPGIASVNIAVLLACSSLASAQTRNAEYGTGVHRVDSSATTDTEETSQPAPTIDAPSYTLLARSESSSSSAPFDASMDVPHKSTSMSLSATHHFVFPTLSQREHSYFHDLLGPGAFIGATAKATVDQTHPLNVGYPSNGYSSVGKHPAHGVVPEWGEGADGYAKRYASAFGMGLVGTTTRYGLGELLHEDVSYHRCQCTGILPRTEHAFLGSFTAHTQSGRAIPSIPALISPFVAAEVGVVAWYPSRYNVSDALRTSTGLYYSLPIKNLIAEFTGR